MACTIAEIQADACESCIGKVTNEVMLLQIIAQLQADYLLSLNPAEDISVDAILARACESGIGKVTDEIKLLQIIAQLECDAAPS